MTLPCVQHHVAKLQVFVDNVFLQVKGEERREGREDMWQREEEGEVTMVMQQSCSSHAAACKEDPD